MDFGKKTGRTLNNSHFAITDQVRTRSAEPPKKNASGALGHRKVKQQVEAPKNFAHEAILRQRRGRKREADQDLNATAPIPLQKRKIQHVAQLNQTADLTKMFRSTSAPHKPKKKTSQKPLAGSKDPVGIQGKGGKKQQVGQANSPPITIRTAPQPVLQEPTISPRDEPEKMNKTVTFAPQRSDTKEETKEDEGGESVQSARLVKPEHAIKRSEDQKIYFIRYRIHQIAPELQWKTLEDLKPHAQFIATFLNAELEARRINMQVLQEKIESWVIACETLQKQDEPVLTKLMERIVPDLQSGGYIQEENPSPWEVLWILQTNNDAADSILKLDFSGLELSAFPPCINELHLPFVRYINCSNNRFYSIPDLLLTLTPGVWTMSFRNNKLKYYPQILPHMPTLFRLDLSRNSIAQMPYDFGVPPENSGRFISIDLSFNSINEITLARFKKTQTRIEVQISGNPVKQSSLPESTGEDFQKVGGLILKWK